MGKRSRERARLRVRTRILVVTAAVLALALVVSVVIAAVNLRAPRPVTAEASSATIALFDSLRNQAGDGVFFGQQLPLDVGVTDAPADVYAAVGDYPVVFGWDTRALEGSEPPAPRDGTPEQGLDALREGIQRVDAMGGINTLSAHTSNFVTGGDYSDTNGDPVAALMADSAPLDAYLDTIADLAESSVDQDGELIPIIFRPFHEANGTWFWWGSQPGTIELYRHSVDYLRDSRGVTNLLFAWSPNGQFDGDQDAYLADYPGDDYVDVLGYDSYESNNDADDSDDWIAAVVTDLAMVSRTAESRGKIAAFTEFGRNGDRTIRDYGNRSLTFFTDLMAGIEANPDARRIAYFMTWANWDSWQLYVPYPGHDMLADFESFYDDPATVFLSDVSDN